MVIVLLALPSRNTVPHEAFIALSQVVMATETQQSPMLQAEASQEGTNKAYMFDASVHIHVLFCHS